MSRGIICQEGSQVERDHRSRMRLYGGKSDETHQCTCTKSFCSDPPASCTTWMSSDGGDCLRGEGAVQSMLYKQRSTSFTMGSRECHSCSIASNHRGVANTLVMLYLDRHECIHQSGVALARPQPRYLQNHI